MIVLGNYVICELYNHYSNIDINLYVFIQLHIITPKHMKYKKEEKTVINLFQNWKIYTEHKYIYIYKTIICDSSDRDHLFIIFFIVLLTILRDWKFIL